MINEQGKPAEDWNDHHAPGSGSTRFPDNAPGTASFSQTIDRTEGKASKPHQSFISKNSKCPLAPETPQTVPQNP